MQLSFFEDTELKHNRIEYVAKRIIHTDSIRGDIKKSIYNRDRGKLIELYNESIRTYGFGGHEYDGTAWMWGQGELRGDNGEIHNITARQLADISLGKWGGKEWQNHDG